MHLEKNESRFTRNPENAVLELGDFDVR